MFMRRCMTYKCTYEMEKQIIIVTIVIINFNSIDNFTKIKIKYTEIFISKKNRVQMYNLPTLFSCGVQTSNTGYKCYCTRFIYKYIKYQYTYFQVSGVNSYGSII